MIIDDLITSSHDLMTSPPHIHRRYASIAADKQFYVLSNLIKSAVLLSYSPLAAFLLYETMVNDVWPVSNTAGTAMTS